MDREEQFEHFIEELLETYRMEAGRQDENEDEHLEMLERGQRFYDELRKHGDHLDEQFDDYMDAKANQDIEEQKYIYKQGALDTITLLKKLGIL